MQGAKASPRPQWQLSRSEAKVQAAWGPVGRRGAERYLSSLPCPHPGVSIFVKSEMSGVWLSNLQFQFPEVPNVPGTNVHATDVFS